MRLTTRQIARVLDRDVDTAARRIATWRSQGVAVERSLTGGRPTMTVAVADVALRVGMTVAEVLDAAGVECEREAA